MQGCSRLVDSALCGVDLCRVGIAFGRYIDKESKVVDFSEMVFRP